jgi:uncharacterized protein
MQVRLATKQSTAINAGQMNRLFFAAAVFAVSLVFTACQSPAPIDKTTPSRPTTPKDKVAQERQSAATAQALEQSASQQTADARNRLLLQAAREWLVANDIVRAQQALAQMSGALAPVDMVSRQIIAADIALQSQFPARALDEIDRIPAPLPRDRATEILEIKSKALFAYGRPLGAIIAATDREQMLNNPSDIENNRRMIWEGVELSASKGANMTPPPGTNRVTAGWLELGKAVLALTRNPFSAQAPINDWRTKYPEHPANDFLNRNVLPQLSASQQLPTDIAVLLPMTGKQQTVSAAIRDGILSASLQQPSTQRPRIRFYDTNLGVANVYKQATSEGAQFVVGPLLKEDVVQLVNAFANSSVTPAPTLALNTLTNAVASNGATIFQFALDPTDEAEQAAQQVMADGKKHGVIIVPDNEWGQRVQKAFAAKLNQFGGSVVAATSYNTANKDFSAPVKSVLLVDESRARSHALNAVLGSKLEFEPRVRGDIEFIFVGAEPAAGRLLRPVLRFHLLDEVPIYATSNIFEPDSNAKANAELNGVLFPDMPWIIAPDDAATQLRALLTRYWPTRMRGGNNRLFAFGFDAYRLIPALQARSANLSVNAIPGMTGTLSVDAEGRVHRQLQWAKVTDGQAQPVMSTLPIQASQASIATPNR